MVIFIASHDIPEISLDLVLDTPEFRLILMLTSYVM